MASCFPDGGKNLGNRQGAGEYATSMMKLHTLAHFPPVGFTWVCPVLRLR